MMFFQTVDNNDSDLAIMMNDIALCNGNAVREYDQGSCSTIVELQVGDVVNVKVVFGDAVLNGSESGKINGFAGFLYTAL